MQTLLIYPPFIRLHGIRYRFFPIGLGYLAGALREAGKSVAVYNAENFGDGETLIDRYTYSDNYRLFQAYQQSLDDPGHYVWTEIEDVIRRYRPDLVGVSVKSCMVPSSRRISRIVKRIDPGITVVWGGPHASIVPDEAIKVPEVDLVVRHEGERTIVELVGMLESGARDLSSIDGLVWKRDGEIVHNRPRQNVPEVDRIPFPDKTANLMPERYEADRFGVMFTSRGCPWPCTFCDSRGVWTRNIRYRTPENVIEEMLGLYDGLGVRDFFFWDDTFTPNRKLSMRLFDLMIETFPKTGRPITWQATTRCDCVDDELARKMKQSGCRMLTFGIESGSPSMMEILQKGITHEKVHHCARVMKKAGIEWEAFFMIGFPDDTPRTIEETMELIRELDIVTCISIFTPYPNTELYERAKHYGLIHEPLEWRYYSHQSPKNHFVRDLSKEEFQRISAGCLAEVDRLNARVYYRNRLRFYMRHPARVPGKVLSVLASALRRTRRQPAAVGIGNLPHSQARSQARGAKEDVA
ncbi:MAG: B12-binding domain-containing radical SAM protein [Planctomycetota bacterium]